MARYRPVSPEESWRSSRSAALTIVERYGELYLLTCPFTNAIGCFSIVPRIAAAEMGVSQEELTNILERLETKGIVCYLDGYVVVKTWFLHSTWESTLQGNVAKAAAKEIAELPIRVQEQWVQATVNVGVPREVVQRFVPLISGMEGPSKGLSVDDDSLESPLVHSNHNQNLNETEPTTSTSTSEGGGGGQFIFERAIEDLVDDLPDWVAGLDGNTAQLVIDEFADAVERAAAGKRDPIGRPRVWVGRLVKDALAGKFKPDGAVRIQNRRARQLAHARAMAASEAQVGKSESLPKDVETALAEFRSAKAMLRRHIA